MGLLTLDPRVEKVQHEMYAILAKHGLKADNNTADTWDAALITVAGLRAIGPSATAAELRRWIAGRWRALGMGERDRRRTAEEMIRAPSRCLWLPALNPALRAKVALAQGSAAIAACAP